MKIKSVDAGKLGRITRGRAKGGAAGAGSARAGRSGGARRDDVALSDNARAYGMADEAMQSAPNVRSELVTPIKEALDAGRYDISSLDVADKILRQVLMERKQSL
ncbi:flagellar biosynthesis anti-sigma factor FlgM [Magnetofaba australis]|uniref:Negative regulator of flagellin synthesis n=1 Tax=Magnetofaba australis IT-1 TaxID=1434232 RepID=A0A1Y2K2X6_9PROT|nr:flagellar biosynthesis anti-sigma factor FlgM [Magnetofaba australis]OSM02398.1 putative anti-sigma-28 factor FlgM [Magnetofaba australis IT-1]